MEFKTKAALAKNLGLTTSELDEANTFFNSLSKLKTAGKKTKLQKLSLLQGTLTHPFLKQCAIDLYNQEKRRQFKEELKDAYEDKNLFKVEKLFNSTDETKLKKKAKKKFHAMLRHLLDEDENYDFQLAEWVRFWRYIKNVHRELAPETYKAQVIGKILYWTEELFT